MDLLRGASKPKTERNSKTKGVLWSLNLNYVKLFQSVSPDVHMFSPSSAFLSRFYSSIAYQIR